MLPAQGIAQGAQPILSYNYGAKNVDRVKQTYKILLNTCLIYSVAIWSAVMLLPSVFVSIFTPDAELIEFASRALRIYFSGLIIFGIQIACQMTFVSLGNAPSSVIVAVVRKVVLLIPLIYIVPNFVSDNTMGVYLAEPIADIIAVIFTAILFSFQFKRAIKKIESEEAEKTQLHSEVERDQKDISVKKNPVDLLRKKRIQKSEEKSQRQTAEHQQNEIDIPGDLQKKLQDHFIVNIEYR